MPLGEAAPSGFLGSAGNGWVEDHNLPTAPCVLPPCLRFSVGPGNSRFLWEMGDEKHEKIVFLPSNLQR